MPKRPIVLRSKEGAYDPKPTGRPYKCSLPTRSSLEAVRTPAAAMGGRSRNVQKLDFCFGGSASGHCRDYKFDPGCWRPLAAALACGSWTFTGGLACHGGPHVGPHTLTACWRKPYRGCRGRRSSRGRDQLAQGQRRRGACPHPKVFKEPGTRAPWVRPTTPPAAPSGQRAADVGRYGESSRAGPSVIGKLVCHVKTSPALASKPRGARYLDRGTTRWNSRAPARQGPSPEERHPVYPQRFNWFESTPRNAPRLPIQTNNHTN